MTQLSIDAAMRAAVLHHQAGRVAEAEALYRQVLAQDPNQSAAWHFLGVLAYELNQADVACELIGRSIALDADCAEAHSNLSHALLARGRRPEAAAEAREALRLQPGFPEALNNLALALGGQGLLAEAIDACQEALRLRPGYADAQLNLGNLLCAQGRPEEAVAVYRRLAQVHPLSADAANNLGAALLGLGRADEAIEAYREALRVDPNDACIHYNLGAAFKARERFQEAIPSFRRAAELDPAFVAAHGDLGDCLRVTQGLDEAAEAYRRALALDPNLAPVQNNLGNCLKGLGQVDAALQCYRKAVELAGQPAEHSNLVYTVHLHPDYDAKAILAEAQEWDRRYAQPLRPTILRHDHSPDPDRPLRVGYVSPDFCWHVVGQNLLPLLRRRDRQHFQVFCYSATAAPDLVTDQIRQLSDGWREIRTLSDEKATELIREDRIDVLVDLAMHLAQHRLLLFARKPAPVQATYLAYCSTTGLGAMDYRLSDPYLDPPETDLAVYSERTIRLPRSYWCYEPAGPAPDVSALPAATGGRVTFGCLNNFGKVSEASLDLWAEILRLVPGSRLLLHAPAGSPRRRVAARFAERGLAPGRWEFTDEEPWPGYLRRLQSVDIALDPFPCGGGITTCDALWMGVPVISLRGRTAVGRSGASLLSNVGLPELAARTPDEYVAAAVALARNLSRLAALRAELRPRMERSALRDAPGFAREIEAAYRQMWRNWCAERRSSG